MWKSKEALCFFLLAILAMNEKLAKGAEKCYNCDSPKDGNCQAKQLLANLIKCKSSSSSCYAQIKNGIIRRGCIGDNFVPEENDCLTTDCILCNKSDGCNNKLVQTHVCISCDSTEDSTCKTNSTFHVVESCPLSITSSGCYHSINQNEEQVKRGCATDLSKEERNDCESDSDECKICYGLYCNKRNSSEQCIHCTVEDPNCASKPNESMSKTCKQYGVGGECFSHIGEAGILRGCLHDQKYDFIKQCENNPSNCKVCSTNDEESCNIEVIEMETCIECDSNIDAKCRNESETLKSKIYSTFQAIEHVDCYLSITNGNYKRGSIQDFTDIEQRTDCLSQSDTCKTCVGANCNQKHNFQQCVNCTNLSDSDCMYNSASNKSIICKDYLSSCFTMKKGIFIWFLYQYLLL